MSARPQTLFDKVWQSHIVSPQTEDTPATLYVDLHVVHEVTSFEIDLESTTLTLPYGERHPFPIDAFARYCLLQGIDQLGYLRSQEKAIAAFERARS